MQRWNTLEQIPAEFGPSAVTIGNFDGVHRGHRAVLADLTRESRDEGLQTAAITFEPHPIQVMYPDRSFEQINCHRDRLELLEQTGLDALLTVSFTREFARLGPEEFVHRYLVDALHAQKVVVGRDIRFGWKNSGDLNTLIELGHKYGFSVHALADVEPEDGFGRRWSSTWIREAIQEGDMEAAAEVLGRWHHVGGEVVHGEKRGREMGFPTANLQVNPDGMVPADGIYAGRLTVIRRAGGKDAEKTATEAANTEAANTVAANTEAANTVAANTVAKSCSDFAQLPAAVSIGTNPTFDGVVKTVEAYVLDRMDLDLYGDYVRVELIKRLRPTVKFDGMESLISQMRSDVDQARLVLTRL